MWDEVRVRRTLMRVVVGGWVEGKPCCVACTQMFSVEKQLTYTVTHTHTHIGNSHYTIHIYLCFMLPFPNTTLIFFLAVILTNNNTKKKYRRKKRNIKFTIYFVSYFKMRNERCFCATITLKRNIFCLCVY